ncbi:MAG: MFS transporter [Acidobacteriota bacterium]|nr:MFS transporter [Acidobacteriota bacterium]
MRRPSPKSLALFVVGLAFFTDMFLYYLLVPLLPIYARELHLGQMRVGLLFGSYAIALVMVTLPLGSLADRVGRRKPMLLGLLALGSTTLLFLFAKSYWLLVLARGLQGAAGAATWIPGMALLADYFPREQRGKAMGTAFACANLGVLTGPPLSGYLTQSFGASAPFILGFCLVGMDAAGRAFLLEEVPGEKGERISPLVLVKNPVILVFSGALAMGSALWAVLESTLPLHFDAVLRFGPAEIGLCFAAAALTHTLTSPLMGHLSDRIGRKKVLVTGLALSMVFIPLPVFFRHTGFVVGSMMALGSIASLIMSPSSPAVADAVEKTGSTSFGSAFSILNIAYAVGMMVGPLVGSALVQLLGLQTALILVGLGFGSFILATREVAA